MRSLTCQIGAWVFLLGAFLGIPVLMWLYEPAEIKVGDWQPGERPWWEPEQPLAPLEVSLLVCQLKVPGSPERVC